MRFFSETIHTPQGDENVYESLPYQSFSGETIHTPQGDENVCTVLTPATSSLRNNSHPARGRKILKKALELVVVQKQFTPRKGTKTYQNKRYYQSLCSETIHTP